MTGKELRKQLGIMAILAEVDLADIAKRLGMTPQGLNSHLRLPEVGNKILSKVKDLHQELFGSSEMGYLSEPEAIYYVNKKNDTTMDNELNYLRQRVKDLEAMVKVQGTLIATLQKQTPEQVDDAQGSKRMAG